MVKKWILVMLLLITTLTLVGWGKGKAHYGEIIPDTVKVVKLKEILENPKQYKDKEVVLEGNFCGVCCATDFKYKEGLDMVEVYPKGFSNPKLVMGKPIRLYGIVRSIEKGVKSEAESEEKEEEHHEVYIEAKGVEVK